MVGYEVAFHEYIQRHLRHDQLRSCRSCNRLVIPRHIREQMHFMAVIKSRKRSGFIQIYNTMHLQQLRGTICQ